MEILSENASPFHSCRKKRNFGSRQVKCTTKTLLLQSKSVAFLQTNDFVKKPGLSFDKVILFRKEVTCHFRNSAFSGERCVYYKEGASLSTKGFGRMHY